MWERVPTAQEAERVVVVPSAEVGAVAVAAVVRTDHRPAVWPAAQEGAAVAVVPEAPVVAAVAEQDVARRAVAAIASCLQVRRRSYQSPHTIP
jgi:hypothetical protein